MKVAGIFGLTLNLGNKLTIWKKEVFGPSNHKTTIAANAGTSGTKAFIYLACGHHGTGQHNYYEFGILRRGHSENYLSKTVISEAKYASYEFSFSISDDGYIQYSYTTSNTFMLILG